MSFFQRDGSEKLPTNVERNPWDAFPHSVQCCQCGADVGSMIEPGMLSGVQILCEACTGNANGSGDSVQGRGPAVID